MAQLAATVIFRTENSSDLIPKKVMSPHFLLICTTANIEKFMKNKNLKSETEFSWQSLIYISGTDIATIYTGSF